MKNRLINTFLISCLYFSVQAQRAERYIDKNWRFLKNDVSEAIAVDYNDSGWEIVKVPHDWAITGPFDKNIDIQKVAIEQNGETIPTEKTGRTGALPYIGTGWYRNSFTVPKGERAFLIFGGVMSEPEIYINGNEAIKWANGYSSFYVDITPFICYNKENVIAVKVHNEGESSRWYPGAGIYRPVKLITTNNTCIKPWDITITTPKIDLQTNNAVLNISAKIDNFNRHENAYKININNRSGETLVSVTSNDILSDGSFSKDMDLKNVDLWSPETPYLYIAEVNVLRNGIVIDNITQRFGFRTISFTPENGFQLNGKTRKFKGVCLHHDLGPLGAAVNQAALRRQLQILKDMGCDAIRTAHNMPEQWQMDLCDEMGVMVMAESFDEWDGRAKCKNGYNRFFADWAEKDLVNLIQSNKNHPSIVMWSVGNEIPEQGMKNGGKKLKHLQDICHREDPTRPVTIGMDRVEAAVKNNFASVIDIPGLNYRTHLYQHAYDNLPQGFILGSETTSTVSSRGVYKYPVEKAKNKTYSDFQCSSYDVECCSWSNLPDDDWILQDDKDWVIGEFVWTGFDYLGEPSPYDGSWPSRSSYFGICDLAGLPKDRYYLYKSRWNEDVKTLHMLPHWNHDGRDGEITPVYVYTNYPEVELFVNGESQGKKQKNKEVHEDRYRMRWNDVAYQPGCVEAVAYDEAGIEKERIEIKTAGKPVRLIVEADRENIKANGNDLSFVTVSAVDKDGNFCPLADNQLNFKVSGSAIFKAVCNGDPTSTEVFVNPTMKLFNGKLVVLVEATENPGKAEIKVSGKGLQTATMKINVE